MFVDYYSRWVAVVTTKSTTAERAIKLFKGMFCTHGNPVSVTTDNGPQFRSELFNEYLAKNGIEHHSTTPLWPQANGEVERQNRSLMKRIRIAQAEHRNWKEELQTYLYRPTPHSITGVGHAELLFGRKIRSKITALQDYRPSISLTDIEVRDRDKERKAAGKLYSNNKRKGQESEIKVGDKVLVKQPRENKMYKSGGI